MPRAALKQLVNETIRECVNRPDTHNAACGIETKLTLDYGNSSYSPDTHNAACGIETPDDAAELRTEHVPTHIMLRAALKPL